MSWKTVASGTKQSDFANVTLAGGEHRAVIDLPGLPLLGDVLGQIAAALATQVPGATKVDRSGNTVTVYFNVG